MYFLLIQKLLGTQFDSCFTQIATLTNDLLFSENDVALIIKYTFAECYEPSGTKKRKLDARRNDEILTYSTIKLPALIFYKYLELYISQFIDDCLR